MTAVGGVPGTEVSAAEFRDAMGHFATGVTVITSVGADGEPVGTTASAVTSLSLDPPLVLVCFDLGSLTLQAIRGHGAFVVNVLAAAAAAPVGATSPVAGWPRPGTGCGTGTGRPAVPGWRTCSPSWSARWSTRLPGGDHEIIVGRVRHVETSASPAGPLVYLPRRLCLAGLVSRRAHRG